MISRSFPRVRRLKGLGCRRTRRGGRSRWEQQRRSAVKISYLCANAYSDLSVAARGRYPYPPGLYDRQTGGRSLEANLAHAALADELGFDWVSVSEHHYGPGIIEPNAIVFAAALTQVVKRANIAVLGPIVSV